MANFERDLLQSVHDERTLFLFATRRWGGIGEGLAHLLQQVVYYTDGEPSAWLMSRRIELFRAAMVLILRKIAPKQRRSYKGHK